MINSNLDVLLGGITYTLHIRSEPQKRDILFLTITLANLNRFL